MIIFIVSYRSVVGDRAVRDTWDYIFAGIARGRTNNRIRCSDQEEGSALTRGGSVATPEISRHKPYIAYAV